MNNNLRELQKKAREKNDSDLKNKRLKESVFKDLAKVNRSFKIARWCNILSVLLILGIFRKMFRSYGNQPIHFIIAASLCLLFAFTGWRINKKAKLKYVLIEEKANENGINIYPD